MFAINQKAEPVDCVHERIGLLVEIHGGAGTLFCSGGISLGDFVHRGDRRTDLLEAHALLVGIFGDARHVLVHLSRAVDDCLQALGYLPADLYAAGAALNRILNLGRRFLRGDGAAQLQP